MLTTRPFPVNRAVTAAGRNTCAVPLGALVNPSRHSARYRYPLAGDSRQPFRDCLPGGRCTAAPDQPRRCAGTAAGRRSAAQTCRRSPPPTRPPPNLLPPQRGAQRRRLEKWRAIAGAGPAWKAQSGTFRAGCAHLAGAGARVISRPRTAPIIQSATRRILIPRQRNRASPNQRQTLWNHKVQALACAGARSAMQAAGEGRRPRRQQRCSPGGLPGM
jgi:hypothetical protein